MARYTKTERWFVALFWLMLAGGLAAWLADRVSYATQYAYVKRTRSEMRSIAAAWENYALDTKRYNAPPSGESVRQTGPPLRLSDGRTFPYVIGADDLRRILVPKYITVLPEKDPWGNPYRFAIDAPLYSSTPAEHYLIHSACRDGKFDNPYKIRGRQIYRSSWDEDMVFSDGGEPELN
jgi:hypothetical protein